MNMRLPRTLDDDGGQSHRFHEVGDCHGMGLEADILQGGIAEVEDFPPAMAVPLMIMAFVVVPRVIVVGMVVSLVPGVFAPLS